ncbi:hypothetical protein [Helicobacter ibis]|uniref:Uncharacterized protein n=1 Tax=Helicobacter ibis TaxID=2962633 RepID=A0ABT4VHJ0_9HELI|nr:hypothetical protein [Helicobacter ibis]MDA3969595.1 hypothetical protein [Helicobacter ibis]
MAEMINKNIISTNESVRKDGAMIDEITKVAQDKSMVALQVCLVMSQAILNKRTKGSFK